MARLAAISTIAALAGVSLLLASPAFGASDKTRVVCFGDSITKGQLAGADESYPAQLARLLGVEAINSGVGGNTTDAAMQRFEKDVLAHQPAAVVILFGTNDSAMVGPHKWKTPLAKYETNLRTMVERCQRAGAKVVLCTMPHIVPERYYPRHPKEFYDAEGGLEKVLDSYRAAVRKVAADFKAPVVELEKPIAAAPAYLNPDGVHPTAAGYKVIGELVAKTLAPLLGKPAPKAAPIQGPK
jgi:lysophospholipase L1-like esterase